MAAVLASRPTASRMPSSSSTTPPFVKLKDSCVKCAASKIKCTKEKPGCARCVKKGLPCEYSVSRRSGRSSVSHSSRSSVQPNQPYVAPRPSPSDSPTFSRSTSWTQQDSYNDDIFMGNNWLDGVPEADMSPSFATNDMDWESLVASLNTTAARCDDMQQQQQSSAQFSGCDDGTSYFDFGDYDMSATDPVASIETESLFTPDWTMQSNSSLNTSPGLNSATSSSTSPASSRSTSFSVNSKHCLQTALGLLKQMSPSSDTCALKKRSPHGSTSSSHSRSSSTEVDGKITISSLQHILDCSCSSNDRYILTIVALITLKQLSRAATTASQGCLAAQAVMSELHEIRRLIHTWSLRVADLQRAISGRGRSGSSSSGSSMDNTMLGHSLDQLQNDLWVAVNRVSTETIDALRRR